MFLGLKDVLGTDEDTSKFNFVFPWNLFPLFKINMDTPPPPNCKTHHLHCLSYPQYLPVPQKHLLSLRGCHHHYHFQVCQLFVNASSCFWHRYPLLWMIMLPVATLSSSKKNNNIILALIQSFQKLFGNSPFRQTLVFSDCSFLT